MFQYVMSLQSLLSLSQNKTNHIFTARSNKYIVTQSTNLS